MVLANLGAVIGFVPWLTGLIADLNSPTTKLLGLLAPFTLANVRVSLEHWSIGYPYQFVGLGSVPGPVGLALLSAGVALGVIAVAPREPATFVPAGRCRPRPDPDPRLALPPRSARRP